MSALVISGPISGVPVERRMAHMGPLARALWGLQVGQCLDVSGYRDCFSVMKRASRYNQLWPERRYTCRKQDGAVRVWRVR